MSNDTHPMTPLDAAALAAILDPERKVPGWWKRRCQECGQIDAHTFQCSRPIIQGEWVFTGPSDLHTAREHNWRLEDWIVAQSTDDVAYIVIRGSKTSGVEMRKIGVWSVVARVDDNHTAALVAVIERISNG